MQYMFICVRLECLVTACMLLCTCILYTGVVEAIDKAWEMDKPYCVSYYR